MATEILIVGAGRTGQALLHYFAERVSAAASKSEQEDEELVLTLVDEKPLPASFPVEHESYMRFFVETDKIPAPKTKSFYDQALMSPGISPASLLFKGAAACAKELISEVEFVWREMPARWIGITGTNGKTTTTTCTAHLLQAAGLSALAAGNIGLPLAEVAALGQKKQRAAATQGFSAPQDKDPWIVAELSSFQLETTRKFHPAIACLLNVAPDHLAWHQGFENYRRAKEKIFAHQTKMDWCVVVSDDRYTQAIAQSLAAKGARLCEVSVERIPDAANRAFIRPSDEMLLVEIEGKTFELCTRASVPLPGKHNVSNVLAAATMSLLALLEDFRFAQKSPDELSCIIREALLAQKALPHRIEEIATIAGVTYINDSKATNLSSVNVALKALTASKTSTKASTILLLGGQDKHLSLMDEEFLRAVQSTCKEVVCFGAAAPRFYQELQEALGSKTALYQAKTMEEAFFMARDHAKPFERILLSPGCSSFDEFSSFEERGDAFRKLVVQTREDLR